MKFSTLILAITLCLLNSPAFAEDDKSEGFYLGGSFGNSTFDGQFDEDNLGDIDFKSDDTGYKLFGIIRFGVFALEGGYIDFGAPTSTSPENEELKYELTGWDLFAVGNLTLGPVDLFGKVGLFLWNEDQTQGSISVGNKGTDLAYGAGITVNIGSLGLRAEYERFEISSLDNVDMYSLGITIKL